MRDLESRSPGALVGQFLDPNMASVLNRNEDAGVRLLVLCSVPPEKAASWLDSLTTYHDTNQARLLPALGIASYFIHGVRRMESRIQDTILPDDHVAPFLNTVISMTRPGGEKPFTYLGRGDLRLVAADCWNYPPTQYDILGDVETAVDLRNMVICGRDSAYKRRILKDFTDTFSGTASVHGERLIQPMIQAAKGLISLPGRRQSRSFDLVKIREQFGRPAGSISQMPRA